MQAGPALLTSQTAGAAGLGLSGLGLVAGLLGDRAASRAAAERGRFGARQARIQGMEIGAAHRDQFNRAASTVQAIRAATGASARSPSTRAFISGQERSADRNRMIQQTDRLAAGLQEEEDARFRENAARFALLGQGLGGVGRLGLGAFSLFN